MKVRETANRVNTAGGFMAHKKKGRRVKAALSWSAIPLAAVGIFGIVRKTSRNGSLESFSKASERLGELTAETGSDLHKLIDDLQKEREPEKAEQQIDQAFNKAKERLDSMADTLKKGVRKTIGEANAASGEQKRGAGKTLRSGSNIPGMHFGLNSENR